MKRLQVLLIAVICLFAVSMVFHAIRTVESDSVPWSSRSSTQCGQFELGGYEDGDNWNDKYALLAHPSIPYSTSGYGSLWNQENFHVLGVRAGALPAARIKLAGYTFIVIHPEKNLADHTSELVAVYDYEGTGEEFLKATTPIKNNGEVEFDEMLEWILEVNKGKLHER